MTTSPKKNQSKDNAEEKILKAARKIFLKKGFAATRTRDIATEAGINLALLNYYFRSKEKLFALVMQEKVQLLFKSIIPVVTDEKTSLDEKMKLMVSNYIRILSEHPDLPIFVINEIRKKESGVVAILPFAKNKEIHNIPFFRQVRELQADLNPVHLLLNLLGMTIFPFLASPILLQTGMIDSQAFAHLMKERETKIPEWMHVLMEHHTKPIKKSTTTLKQKQTSLQNPKKTKS